MTTYQGNHIRRRAAVLAAALLLLLPLAARGGDDPGVRERAVPTEAALWAAAGQAFAGGVDKSAAMQQYRLFVQEYGGSERAAEAQYMVGECYFAAGDYDGALREYDKVDGRKGRTDYLQASVLLRQGECYYNTGRADEAVARYNRLIDKYDDTFLLAEGLYEIGLTYIVEGNWLKLRSAYRELLEQRPGYGEMPQVKFALGLFSYQEKDYDQAIAYFSEVPSDRGLYYLGRCLEDTGQYILAIQRYRQVLRKYPDSPLADDVAFSVAEAFYRSGQNAVAVQSYREFIDQYPDSRFVANARYKMACVTYNEKHYDESVRQLEEIVRLFPDEMIAGYAQYLIGDCYAALDRRAEAIFAWTDAVRRFEGSRVASAAMHKIIFTYTAERNYGQAIVLADEFLRQYPGDSLAPRVRVLQGFSHFQLEEYREAIMCFQNVVDKNVNTDVAERALFLSTLAYFRIEQLDRVITNYNYIASRLLPTPSHWRARTYYYLGEAYFAQGLYRQAEGMYRLVLTGYPRSNVAAASLQGLVASLSRSGDYELALQEQEKFLLALANADSDKGTNSLAVGSIYFNQHKYEDALRQFGDFLAKHPDDPAAAAALANQGDCYYRLQYYDQAIESWRSLLTRFPAAPEAEESIYRIADTQFGLGRYADAAATYSQLQERFPAGARAADAAFGVANCAYNQGQDDRAIESFGAFLAAYPDDPRVEDAELGVQSCYYRSGRDMEQYLATNPESPLAADIFWNKGQDAFAAGDFTTAAKAFERVTLDYPESESGPGALFYLAESYYRNGGAGSGPGRLPQLHDHPSGSRTGRAGLPAHRHGAVQAGAVRQGGHGLRDPGRPLPRRRVRAAGGLQRRRLLPGDGGLARRHRRLRPLHRGLPDPRERPRPLAAGGGPVPGRTGRLPAGGRGLRARPRGRRRPRSPRSASARASAWRRTAASTRRWPRTPRRPTPGPPATPSAWRPWPAWRRSPRTAATGPPPSGAGSASSTGAASPSGRRWRPTASRPSGPPASPAADPPATRCSTTAGDARGAPAVAFPAVTGRFRTCLFIRRRARRWHIDCGIRPQARRVAAKRRNGAGVARDRSQNARPARTQRAIGTAVFAAAREGSEHVRRYVHHRRLHGVPDHDHPGAVLHPDRGVHRREGAVLPDHPPGHPAVHGRGRHPGQGRRRARRPGVLPAEPQPRGPRHGPGPDPPEPLARRAGPAPGHGHRPGNGRDGARTSACSAP